MTHVIRREWAGSEVCGVYRVMVRTTGDASAEDARVFTSLYPDLRRFAAACSLADQDPDDLVQEALVRVLSSGSLAALEAPAAYLRASIRNLVKNELRSRHRGGIANLRLGAQTDSCDTYPSDLGVLGRLSIDDRAVLFLVDIESHSCDEAARMLGWSLSKAKRRLSSARSTVRSVLEKEPRF